ncbi:MAG: hypothetical protein LBN71_10060 [Tannerella sp.]|jgi:hypothetical protein|nr:hypothetical protein [Tannerella sp.]
MYNFLYKKSLFIAGLFLIIIPVWSQETVEIYPNVQSQKKLKLCATFLTNVFKDPPPDVFLLSFENAIDKYGIDMVNAHSFSSDEWVSYKGYDKVRKTPDPERINRYRSYYKRIKDKGVYLIISGGEPVVPKDLFEKYPEMKHVNNQKFWQFMEDKTQELFDVLPEMDCFEIYLWETPVVDDAHLFEDLKFNEWGSFPYYSQADYFKYLFDALSRAAHDKNKDFMLLTFSHYPYQEQIMIDALKSRDRNYPFLLDHKCQPGDWVPFKPANNIMQTVTDMPALLQFDGTGEYWGQSLMPYCYPEEIQARVQHALACNPSINGLNMRVNWEHGSLFGKPNEINFYALSRLADDPFTPVERIWEDWAVERFGEKSAGKVISALQRTDDIGRRIFYVEGMWVFNHSAFANLSYLESHIVNYAKCTALLKPGDFLGNYKMNELLNYPREYVINEVLADRDEAIRLNALSLQDIEDAKKTLKPEDYQLLKEQLTRQRDMARASKLHLEAFFRYRIEKLNTSGKGPENLKKLETCLLQIVKMADEMDKVYQDGFPFLKGSLLKEYVEQVRTAVR